MAKIKAKAEVSFLLEEFNLTRTTQSNLLSDWLAVGTTAKLDDWAEATLSKIEPKLHARIDGWLEEELKMKLLSPILLLAEFDESPKIDLFFERQITAEIDNFRIHVIVDCMVSSVYGYTVPRTPYFFMQEFKKSKGDSQDPEGQMLAAMLAAQHLNQNGKPLYGSYVVGRYWCFTVLEGKNYASSEALHLTQPDELRQVILTLRKLKQIILNDLMD